MDLLCSHCGSNIFCEKRCALCPHIYRNIIGIKAEETLCLEKYSKSTEAIMEQSWWFYNLKDYDVVLDLSSKSFKNISALSDKLQVQYMVADKDIDLLLSISLSHPKSFIFRISEDKELNGLSAMPNRAIDALIIDDAAFFKKNKKYILRLLKPGGSIVYQEENIILVYPEG